MDANRRGCEAAFGNAAGKVEAALDAAEAAGQLVRGEGVVNNVVVLHDPWCEKVRTGGPCDCDPDVRVGAPDGLPGPGTN